MSEPPLTDDEIRRLRKIATGISGPEWGALKAIASGVVSAMSGGSAGQAHGGLEVATDAELRSAYGDKVLKKMPRRWAGADFSGAKMSQCPSELLDVHADQLEYVAGKKEAEPEPKKHRNGTFWYVYDRKEAALARGWSRKNQGKHFDPPMQATCIDDPYAPRDGADGSFDQSGDQSDAGEWAP